VLAPACISVIEHYRDGTDGPIRMDGDGLISAGDITTQLTWMDAKRDGVVFTPRHGKAVEINALWYSNLVGLHAALVSLRADAALECHMIAERAKKSFNKVFRAKGLKHLVDHVSERGPDYSLRPNQVFAVSLPHSPLPKTVRKTVMRQLHEKLLTPMGLRTLPTDDANYHGRYAGSMFERDEAYHQGTVWAWPIGHYVEGYLRAFEGSLKAIRHCREAIAPLLAELSQHSIGQLHEVFDGDAPHRPSGCIAQAWSVAEVLRAVVLIEAAAKA